MCHLVCEIKVFGEIVCRYTKALVGEIALCENEQGKIAQGKIALFEIALGALLAQSFSPFLA
jgi:hypothetical protein